MEHVYQTLHLILCSIALGYGLGPESRLNKGVEDERLTRLTADSRLPRGWPARTVQPLTRLGDFIIFNTYVYNIIMYITTLLPGLFFFCEGGCQKLKNNITINVHF